MSFKAVQQKVAFGEESNNDGLSCTNVEPIENDVFSALEHLDSPPKPGNTSSPTHEYPACFAPPRLQRFVVASILPGAQLNNRSTQISQLLIRHTLNSHLHATLDARFDFHREVDGLAHPTESGGPSSSMP